MQYRGHNITVESAYIGFSAASDQYDAFTRDGHWFDNGLCQYGKTPEEALDALRDAIDEFEDV